MISGTGVLPYTHPMSYICWNRHTAGDGKKKLSTELNLGPLTIKDIGRYTKKKRDSGSY